MQSKHWRKFASIAAIALTLALGALSLTGCAATAANEGDEATATQETKTITDMLGRTVEVPAQTDKVIGIGSSSLRVLAYLNAIDKVVGVEQSELEDQVLCCYRHVNHDKLAGLPVIGEGGAKGTTPNEEAIMETNPQVIFANIDKDAADALQQKTGIPVVGLTVSNMIFDQEFYDNVNLMGDVVGAQDRAAEIVAYMQDTEKDLQARTAGLPEDQIKTAYAAGISFRGGHGFAGTEAQFPPFMANNVKNIADVDGMTGAFDIDLEAVTAAQPDYIFVESGNLSLMKDDYTANPAYFESLNAVKDGKVNTLISYRFYAANVELALANCYQVGAVVYPEQFKDIDPTEKLDEITRFFLGESLSEDLAAEGCEFQQVDIATL